MLSFFPKKKAETAVEPEEAREEVLTRIIPVVKVFELEPPDAVPIELPAEDSPVSRPLAADLVVFYAEDLPDRYVFVSKRRMAQLGLTAPQLHALALSNLPGRLPEIQLHGEAPRHMLTCGGNFEASLLLYDGLWETLAERLPGPPMVAVPARDLLFVTGASWDGAHQFLSELANMELEDKRYALSKQVFLRTGGTWTIVGLAS